MPIIQTTIPQLKSDLIWLSKGHYWYENGAGERVFVENPKLHIVLEVLNVPLDTIMDSLTELVAQAIMDDENPTTRFKDLLYYCNNVAVKRLMKMDGSYNAEWIARFTKEHWVEFLFASIAGWKIPDEYQLTPPSWDPDKFKKKGKVKDEYQ